jgi:hypothetical protein
MVNREETQGRGGGSDQPNKLETRQLIAFDGKVVERQGAE